MQCSVFRRKVAEQHESYRMRTFVAFALLCASLVVVTFALNAPVPFPAPVRPPIGIVPSVDQSCSFVIFHEDIRYACRDNSTGTPLRAAGSPLLIACSIS